FIGLVEGGLVIDLAKPHRVLEMWVAAELLTHIAVEAEIMKEIIALKDAVMFHHPVQFPVHEGLKDGRGDIGMVVAAERVADIMEKRGDDIVLALAGLVGAGRRLQAVLQSIDWQ